MKFWHAAPADCWQGRNDLAEAANALRLFQSVIRSPDFAPERYPHHIALLGFASDEGVKRNQGRPGAAQGPISIRRALANLASHRGHDRLVDLGDIGVEGSRLEEAQRSLSQAIERCQRAQMRTLVLGGGHETAFGHGLGVLEAFPDRTVGIINFDAHLDLRRSNSATSGTPFLQLAHRCTQQGRPFRYTCVGASLAANTQALVDEAQRLNVDIIWDTDCGADRLNEVARRLAQAVNDVDIVYLTIDLDVLPAWQMPAVSAPAPLGLPLDALLRLLQPLCQSPKLRAADLVELNPAFDIDSHGAKTAARLAWQIAHWWNVEQEESSTPA